MRCTIGCEARIEWDCGKPGGTPRKLLDVSRLVALGWKRKISLQEGLRRTYAEYVAEVTVGS
ncbi:MAG TPA: hypothetical protein VNE59_06680 [Burkholderiales bacterium]|nr:hypothetical protein [Burkholderiales bacterium]